MKQLFEEVIALMKESKSTAEAKTKVMIKLLQLQVAAGEKDAAFPEDLFSSLDSAGREAVLNSFILAMVMGLEAAQ